MAGKNKMLIDHVLKILNKHIANERAWLRTESLAALDWRYREGAKLAKARVPQLERAIKILGDVKKVCSKPGVSAQAPKPNPQPPHSIGEGRGEAITQLKLDLK